MKNSCIVIENNYLAAMAAAKQIYTDHMRMIAFVARHIPIPYNYFRFGIGKESSLKKFEKFPKICKETSSIYREKLEKELDSLGRHQAILNKSMNPHR